MAVAVIATGGKQYLVHEGDLLEVEKLESEADKTLEFPDILNGKTVSATVMGHDRHDKVQVVKFKSKVRYLRRRGHRQALTKLRIDTIG